MNGEITSPFIFGIITFYPPTSRELIYQVLSKTTEPT